jgi:hypothetical protein
MVSDGLIMETLDLILNGMDPDSTAARAVGYRQAIQFIHQGVVRISLAISCIGPFSRSLTKLHALLLLVHGKRIHDISKINDGQDKTAYS